MFLSPFFCGSVSIGAPGKPVASEVLFARLKPAVAKISVLTSGVEVQVGAGFFIGPNGEMVTNHHVFRDALDVEHTTVAITLSDGRRITDLQVAGCGDSRKLDLCLLKLPLPSPAFLKPGAESPGQGQKIYVIGHPAFLDYTVTDGVLSGIRDDFGFGAVQISAPVNPGNSGGPIYDDRGNLVGMTTSSMRAAQNINLGISAREISEYVAKNVEFKSLAETKHAAQQIIAGEIRRLKAEVIDAAYSKIAQGQPVTSLPNQVSLNSPLGILIGHLPTQFSNCKFGGASLMECRMGKTAFVLKAQMLGSDAPLSAIQGKLGEKPSATKIVETLEQAKRWEKIRPTLTAEELKSFVSEPSPISCSRLVTGLFNAREICEATVKNKLMPADESKSVMVKVGSVGLEASVWVSDRNLEPYWFEIPKLFLSTLQQTGRPAGASLTPGKGAPPKPAKPSRSSASDVLSPRALFEKACSNRDKDACVELSNQYMSPKSPEKSLEKALYYATQGCELGAAKGCIFLGLLYHNGRGVTQSNARAIEYLAQACDMRDGLACRYLGTIRAGGHIQIR